MLTKDTFFFGNAVTLACDGRCDKAWGMNGRPKLYFMEEGQPPRPLVKGEKPKDWGDHVYIGDNDLGTAPEDPGTYEGGDGKPSGTPLEDASDMNKWCARECERNLMVDRGKPLVLPNLDRPEPNMAKRRLSPAP